MAKKKKVNDVIPPDAPPEVVEVIDEGEEVKDANESEPPHPPPPPPTELGEPCPPTPDTPGPPPFRQMADGRYCETTYTREREVRIAGQRYEHVAEDDHGYWIYDKG